MKRFLRQWQEIIHELELTLVDNLASTIPWLAPIVPAYIAWHSMETVLQFPAWVSISGGIVIEFLGLATVTTALQFWDYNDKRRASDQPAPFIVAVLCAAFYLAVILTVNVILDDSGNVERFAKSLLSLLSIIAAVVLAIRSQHARRLSDIIAAKEEKKAQKTQEKELELSETLQKVSKKVSDWRKLSDAEKDVLRGLSPREIREIFPDITEKTAQNWKKNLSKHAE